MVQWRERPTDEANCDAGARSDKGADKCRESAGRAFPAEEPSKAEGDESANECAEKQEEPVRTSQPSDGCPCAAVLTRSSVERKGQCLEEACGAACRLEQGGKRRRSIIGKVEGKPRQGAVSCKLSVAPSVFRSRCKRSRDRANRRSANALQSKVLGDSGDRAREDHTAADSTRKHEITEAIFRCAVPEGVRGSARLGCHGRAVPGRG